MVTTTKNGIKMMTTTMKRRGGCGVYGLEDDADYDDVIIKMTMMTRREILERRGGGGRRRESL